MGNNQAIFKRVEKKFLLTSLQYDQLLQMISDRLSQDKYFKSTICNIYFDTPNFYLIRKSLEKPIYKEKLRLRTYGVPNQDSTAFIELKKKYKGVVYKRRIDIKYKDAVNYLYSQIPLDNPSQISKEIDWFMNNYENIGPAMFISYDRLAYFCTENPNLRITFDSNITYRTDTLYLSEGVYGEKIIKPTEKLMEIKIPGAMPIWLANALSNLKIFPTSFSKYGRGYTNICINDINNDRGGIHCAWFFIQKRN